MTYSAVSMGTFFRAGGLSRNFRSAFIVIKMKEFFFSSHLKRVFVVPVHCKFSFKMFNTLKYEKKKISLYRYLLFSSHSGFPAPSKKGGSGTLFLTLTKFLQFRSLFRFLVLIWASLL